MKTLHRMGRGLVDAVRARPGTFAGVGALVLVLDVLVPPLVLSLARKPVDYFTWNPWLGKLPDYLLSDPTTLRVKLDKLWGLALFWFSADSPFGGTEWGYAVDVRDLGRLLITSLLVGLYFALWRQRRRRAESGWTARATRSGGVAGALVSVVGLSTGPCSVMGCGAPVLPVVGLAFVGLSSTTLTMLSRLSTTLTTALLVVLIGAVAALAWGAGKRLPRRGL